MGLRIARWDESQRALGRHSIMLASLVVLWVALPVGNGLTEGGTSFSILLALVSIAAVFVHTPQRWSFIAASLIGLCFAMMFLLICDLAPGSIDHGEEPIVRSVTVTGSSSQATKLLSFSFVTVTTLGYGDFTPRTERAQMMSVAEAMIGQLYLAISVPRLVALYFAGDRRHPRRLGQHLIESND